MASSRGRGGPGLARLAPRMAGLPSSPAGQARRSHKLPLRLWLVESCEGCKPRASASGPRPLKGTAWPSARPAPDSALLTWLAAVSSRKTIHWTEIIDRSNGEQRQCRLPCSPARPTTAQAHPLHHHPLPFRGHPRLQVCLQPLGRLGCRGQTPLAAQERRRGLALRPRRAEAATHQAAEAATQEDPGLHRRSAAQQVAPVAAAEAAGAADKAGDLAEHRAPAVAPGRAAPTPLALAARPVVVAATRMQACGRRLPTRLVPATPLPAHAPASRRTCR